MKFNTFNAIIALLLAALLGYLCYCINPDQGSDIIIGIASFITIAVPLVAAVAAKVPEYPRTSVLLKTTASLFTVASVAVNLIFAFFDFSAPVYIIIVGIICLIFLLVFNGIYRAKQ